ncbi:ATP-binding protein [Oligoflexia bacterium]|nr:ATP-binding protein [Oligoflexia bacterium]
MKVLLADTDRDECSDLTATLTSWGFAPLCCQTEQAITDILTADEIPPLIILDWDYLSSKIPTIITALRERMFEHPMYIILLGDAKNDGKLIQALDYGAHDFITRPVNLELLKRKTVIGQSIIQDKQALMDSSSVLERYSKYIDQIALERAQQLVHTERLSSIGVMSAGIAHEINTPISYISTSIQSAQSHWRKIEKIIQEQIAPELLEDPANKRSLESIPKALNRMAHGLEKVITLTTSLKNFGKASRSKRTNCCINTCVSEALEICGNLLRKGVSVETHLAPDLPPINADQQKIEQVLINLMVNACHAMEGQEQKALCVTTSNSNNKITILVEDSGPGIDPDKLDNIWKAFYTTKEKKGTGLGLAITLGIVREHSGSIEVINKAEGGARFEITLPCAETKTP